MHVFKTLPRLLRKELIRLGRMEVGRPLWGSGQQGEYCVQDCVQGQSTVRKNKLCVLALVPKPPQITR